MLKNILIRPAHLSPPTMEVAGDLGWDNQPVPHSPGNKNWSRMDLWLKLHQIRSLLEMFLTGHTSRADSFPCDHKAEERWAQSYWKLWFQFHNEGQVPEKGTQWVFRWHGAHGSTHLLHPDPSFTRRWENSCLYLLESVQTFSCLKRERHF